jgi:hypothetical protein
MREADTDGLLPASNLIGVDMTDEELASERANLRMGVNQPGYRSLAAHMHRFGPDGIVESAGHLDPEQQEKLAVVAKRMHYSKKERKWVTS